MCSRRRVSADDVDLSFLSQNIASKESIVELLRDWDSLFVLFLTPNILAYGAVAK